jgi:hypothetical protein
MSASTPLRVLIMEFISIVKFLVSASILLMMRLVGAVMIVWLVIIKSINDGASLFYASLY